MNLKQIVKTIKNKFCGLDIYDVIQYAVINIGDVLFISGSILRSDGGPSGWCCEDDSGLRI
jgi:hypothetical protein